MSVLPTVKRLVLVLASATGYGAMIVYVNPELLVVAVFGGIVLVAIMGFGYVLSQPPTPNVTARPPLLLHPGVVGIGVLAVLAVPVNISVNQRMQVVAKAYPDVAAPLLEQYRHEHGVYPASLDLLPSHPHLPWILVYRSHGLSYEFYFEAGMMDSWNYSSLTHAWYHAT